MISTVTCTCIKHPAPLTLLALTPPPPNASVTSEEYSDSPSSSEPGVDSQVPRHDCSGYYTQPSITKTQR